MNDTQAPDDFLGMEDAMRAYLSAKHAAREGSLALARLVIRHAANAIRATHRREYATARDLLAQSSAMAVQARAQVQDQPSLMYSGYLQDALKELAEAALFLAFVQDQRPPSPQALELTWEPYLAGMAETVGELRRYALDALRRDEFEVAEGMLARMSAIYELLITVDFPDAVTGSLRHATDAARAILERTRGDVTMAVQQHHLEAALRAAHAPWQTRQ
jgi:translin